MIRHLKITCNIARNVTSVKAKKVVASILFFVLTGHGCAISVLDIRFFFRTYFVKAATLKRARGKFPGVGVAKIGKKKMAPAG
jgi:hypothetical protein